ncbi:hypothetical protein MKEN_00223300 [Mycena kentingensis (nom. inval.)]|nr:hypothetical protein MKEN_00223300 [Mycena kentingensis (nom. inval.)]
MFILPALAAHPLADVAPQSPLRPCASVSISALDIKLRVSPLTALLTALLASILLRAVVVTALRRVRPSAFSTGKHRRSPSVEDGAARDGVDPVADKPTPSKGQWYDGVFALDVLQPMSLAEALPITLHPPPPPSGGEVAVSGSCVGQSVRLSRGPSQGWRVLVQCLGSWNPHPSRSSFFLDTPTVALHPTLPQQHLRIPIPLVPVREDHRPSRFFYHPARRLQSRALRRQHHHRASLAQEGGTLDV